MYLSNQERLPQAGGRPAGSEALWRLHFEYDIENREDADMHAALCRQRGLRVKVDENDKPVQRRRTTAVLTAADNEGNPLDRLSQSATCSWTDTFSKETGRREALARLETLLKAGAEGRLSEEEGRTLALATRGAYKHRDHFRPLAEARRLLSQALEESSGGRPLSETTTGEIRDLLKQLNVTV